MRRLNVALMGLEGAGIALLEALCRENRFALTSVADTDAERLRSRTESLGVSTFDDYRSLLVEGARAGLDLLVVAEAPYRSREFLELAATLGVAVFHQTPWARTAEEGRQIVGRFEAQACPFVVSRPWQFEPAFAGLCDLADQAGSIYAATATVQCSDTPSGWRGDSVRAGGGVLLYGGYELIDLLVYAMGTPEAVYAQCAYGTESRGARTYDTEDFASVSLTFSPARLASMTAVRNAAESGWRVTFYGTQAVIEVSPDRLIQSPTRSETPVHRKVWAKHPVSHALGAMAESLLDAEKPLRSVGREHLATLAVIQAAYLSAKTGDPESPSRMLNDL